MELAHKKLRIALLAIIALALIPFISSKVLAATGLDDSVVLLIHGSGLDQSPGAYKFYDSSFSNHTITTNGDAARVLDKFSQSGFFDGSTDYLTLNGSSDFAFGTGDFTIEFWVRLNSTSAAMVFYDTRPIVTSGMYPTILKNASTQKITFLTDSADRITGTTDLVAGTWYHIALVRSSNVTKLYINGTQEGSNYTDTNNYLNTGGSRPMIGAGGSSNGGSSVDGQIDELRVSKGVARWTSSFTPPTSPYSSDGNTSLLLHADGTSGSTTFTDSSGSPKTVTANGNAVISSFSKFGGDGISFDGSSDYLTTGTSAEFNMQTTGDWTVDFWMRSTSLSSDRTMLHFYSGTSNRGLHIKTGNTTIFVDNGMDASGIAAGTLTTNTWNHIAVVRSGSTVLLFLNGALIDSDTAQDYGNANSTLNIGRFSNGTEYFSGYLDELRVSKGIARWTSNFTPPTEAYGLSGITFTGSVKFLRNIAVVGSLSKGGGTFVIDHPQKPRTHLLYHAFVESPDAKNLYDGIAELDENGEVTIVLPDYFEALNKDFRYQYFPIDEAMPNLHVRQKVKDNTFVIAGGTPGGRISWQITGIRHDPYIEANPIIVEVDKGPDQIVDKGECLHEEACR